MSLNDQSSFIKVLSKTWSLVDTSAWQNRGLPLEWLKKLSDLSQLCSDEDLLQEVAKDYERFNDSKTDADKYCLVDRIFIRLVPLLEILVHVDSDEPYVISFDGLAGSGKTTLANLLGQVLNSSLVHMDDFFLPLNLRSKEREDQAGGNVHYERFRDQVVDNLKSGEAFSYARFDCKIMDYSEEVIIRQTPFIIVEGSYSRHPYFGDYSDLKVFCLVSESEQKSRIEKRNGKDMLKVFESKWIPMENKYLKTFKIKEKSDILV